MFSELLYSDMHKRMTKHLLLLRHLPPAYSARERSPRSSRICARAQIGRDVVTWSSTVCRYVLLFQKMLFLQKSSFKVSQPRKFRHVLFLLIAKKTFPPFYSQSHKKDLLISELLGPGVDKNRCRVFGPMPVPSQQQCTKSSCVLSLRPKAALYYLVAQYRSRKCV